MKVYILIVDPNDYDTDPYIYSVYSTKDKAISAIQTAAIENGEPALLLSCDYDTWEYADCYHYPDYENSRYYIHECTVE